MKFDTEKLENEVVIRTSRSSGKGGQYVNKVSTKVMLILDIYNSKAFDDKQKEILIEKLKKKLSKEGKLIITSESERSQYLNKKRCFEKLYIMLSNTLIEKKERVKTKPTEDSKKKRIKEKKIISEKKLLRKKDFFN